jgi:hypothetical protein
VDVTTKILNYPYALNPFFNIQSFTLTIDDSCPSSQITGPTSVENMVAFAGYSVFTK